MPQPTYVTGGGSNPFNVTETGSKHCLVLGVYSVGGWSAPTFAGSSMTAVPNTAVNVWHNSQNFYGQAFYIFNPPVGSTNFASISGGWYACLYKNVESVSSNGVTGGSYEHGPNYSPSVNVASSGDQLVICGGGHEGSADASAPLSGQTGRSNGYGIGFYDTRGFFGEEAGTSGTVATGSWSAGYGNAASATWAFGLNWGAVSEVPVRWFF